jgi:hypothetical protein
MTRQRTLLLFDPAAKPQVWNERMHPGEFAVLPSFQPEAPPRVTSYLRAAPSCTVFANLADAEQFANHQVLTYPTLRCRIYDHDGLGREPIREIHGKEHRRESEISAPFRRWCGSLLFFGGLALIVLDWTSDFRLTWPATLGVRAFPAGLILLVTELVIVWEARRKLARTQQTIGTP